MNCLFELQESWLWKENIKGLFRTLPQERANTSGAWILSLWWNFKATFGYSIDGGYSIPFPHLSLHYTCPNYSSRIISVSKTEVSDCFASNQTSVYESLMAPGTEWKRSTIALHAYQRRCDYSFQRLRSFFSLLYPFLTSETSRKINRFHQERPEIFISHFH